MFYECIFLNQLICFWASYKYMKYKYKFGKLFHMKNKLGVLFFVGVSTHAY